MMTGMHCDMKAIERAAKAIGMINSEKLVKKTQENTKHCL